MPEQEPKSSEPAAEEISSFGEETDYGEKFNPDLRQEIDKRRNLSVKALMHHGAEILESSELVPTERQIERIKRENERFPDQMMYELYSLVSMPLNILTKLQPSAPLTEEEKTSLHRVDKKERARIETRAARREKERFLAGKVENPHFSYPVLERSKLDLDKVALNLRNIKKVIKESGGDPNLKALYQEKINERIAQVEMLRAVREGDDHRFYRYSRFIYGEPDESVYQAASQEIDSYQPQVPQEEVLPDEVIKWSFEEALRAYGWQEQIRVKSSPRKTQITAGRRSLSVPEGREATARRIRELVAHEIETHILRRMSGEKAPLKIIRKTTLGRYLPTEEGLAGESEKSVSQESGESGRPEFAVRLMGLFLAKSHNFRGTYTALQKIYQQILEKENEPEAEAKAKSLAYDLAVRIFRGIHHPENPGNFYTKDWIYYKGGLDVAHFISEGGDVARLYIGKIGLHHLGILSELGINKPAIIPRFIAAKIEPLEIQAKHKKT